MVKSHTALAPMAGLSHVALPNRATAQMARGTSAERALDQARAVWAGPPRGQREIITHLVTGSNEVVYQRVGNVWWGSKGIGPIHASTST